MQETLDRLNKFRPVAQMLDADLVRGTGREEYIARNYSQISGINRSEKFVKRIAGVTGDDYRQGRSEQMLDWYFATASERPFYSENFRQFFASVFEQTEIIAGNRVVKLSPWQAQEEIDRVLSEWRSAYIAGNYAAMERARNEMRKSLEEMDCFAETPRQPAPLALVRR